MALDQIQAEHRVVLVLRDVQGLEYEQVAEVLGVPMGTIKSRLFRARLALREAIERMPCSPRVRARHAAMARRARSTTPTPPRPGGEPLHRRGTQARNRERRRLRPARDPPVRPADRPRATGAEPTRAHAACYRRGSGTRERRPRSSRMPRRVLVASGRRRWQPAARPWQAIAGCDRADSGRRAGTSASLRW